MCASPLSVAARRGFLARILDLQDRINAAADTQRRPRVDLINADEVTFIERCLENGLYPDKWTGEEPMATELLDVVYADGTEQPLLKGLLR